VQLRIARAAGLRTPRTLVTNDFERAREFAESCGGKLVVKATGKGWLYGPDAGVQSVLTNRISGADLRREEIELAPVTFQEEVPKAYEIRANVVGGRVLAIRIDSQRSAQSEVDWRRYDLDNTPYSPYQLPAVIEAACVKVTKDLGLEYGAIDLIRRPDGEYVFLEINGNGQFLWAEDLSGVEVSQAIAALLTRSTPSLSGSGR